LWNIWNISQRKEQNDTYFKISSPRLKSLAHNKYQVAGRQLLLFMALEQVLVLLSVFSLKFVLLDEVPILIGQE